MKNHATAVKLILVIAVVLAFPFSALHLNAQDATPVPPLGINISMTEYKFAVEGQAEGDTLQLETGKEYTLNFTDAGTLEHEVLIGSNPIEIKGGFHHDFANLLLSDVETDIGGEIQGAEFRVGAAGLNEFEMHPGQKLSITFTLPDDKVGDWEMGCFVSLNPNATEDDPGPGHYDVGMKIPVKVVKGSGT